MNPLFARAREPAPSGLLSRLEEAARRAHEREQRARRLRRRAVAVSLVLAAAVPLASTLKRPEVAPITAENPAARTAEPPRRAEPRPAVLPPPPVASERTSAPSAKPRPPALSQEVAVLAKARQALQDGDAQRALAVLDQYRTQLRAGQLRLEAEVLRLEALSRLGATEEASQRARRFIDENPNSPLVDRARGYVTE